MLIVAGAFTGRGGLQRRLSGMAASLARDRPVTVVTWSPRCWPRAVLRGDGVRVVVVPSLLDWARDHPPAAAAVNTVFSLLTGVAASLVNRRRWGVAYAAGLHPEGTVAALAARRGREFVVSTWLVGPLGNAERLRRSTSCPAVLGLLSRAYRFVPRTVDSAEELIAIGVSPEQITIVGSGVDLQRFVPSGPRDQGRAVAVYAGRFDLRQKRLDLLLDAWQEAELEGWDLVLAGAGDDEPAVRRRAAAQTGVRVLGWQEDVTALFASADLFVLPTVAEIRPNAMLEGMACALPGIISATAGLRVLDPEGVILADNDVRSWVEALRAVDAQGPAGRRALGRRGRDWAETHADRRRETERLLELWS